MERLTPAGMAGVAVYRFAPEEVRSLAARIIPATAMAVAASGRPARATWQLDGGVRDEVLVVAGGDAGVEVHAHGSLVIDAAAQATFGLLPPRATRAADRLLQSALGRAQLELAVEQKGYDHVAELARLACLPASVRRAAIAAALERSRVAMAHAAPEPLHLIGRQNAGKSTLFNKLLGRERSLAGATPGLTRDAVSESVALDGYPYVLYDHAGEGDALDPVDVAAITRSRAVRASGLRVLVVDGSVMPAEVDHALAAIAHVVIAAKGDLRPSPWPSSFPYAGRCSPLEDPVAELQQRVGSWLRAARGLPAAGRVGGFAALDDAEFEALRALVETAG